MSSSSNKQTHSIHIEYIFLSFTFKQRYKITFIDGQMLLLMSELIREEIEWVILNPACYVVKGKKNAEEEERDSVKQGCRTLYKSVCKMQQCVEIDLDQTRQREREMKECNVHWAEFLHEWWPGSCIRSGATLWFHWMKGHTHTHTHTHTYTLKAIHPGLQGSGSLNRADLCSLEGSGCF